MDASYREGDRLPCPSASLAAFRAADFGGPAAGRVAFPFCRVPLAAPGVWGSSSAEAADGTAWLGDGTMSLSHPGRSPVHWHKILKLELKVYR